jgi:hypothetical protein
VLHEITPSVTLGSLPEPVFGAWEAEHAGDMIVRIQSAVGQEEFERTLRGLTRPVAGQYPRPWMTNSRAPLYADVFIVGRSQPYGYPVEEAGDPAEYHDALFNRNGRSCRDLYSRISGNGVSPARRNLDALSARLWSKRLNNVLETNVLCEAAPGDTEIFTFLLEAIKPRVLIAHGAGTVRELELVLNSRIAAPRTEPGPVPATVVSRSRTTPLAVISIPSLIPPAWNRWESWADEHLDAVAERAARLVATGR